MPRVQVLDIPLLRGIDDTSDPEDAAVFDAQLVVNADPQAPGSLQKARGYQRLTKSIQHYALQMASGTVIRVSGDTAGFDVFRSGVSWGLDEVIRTGSGIRSGVHELFYTPGSGVSGGIHVYTSGGLLNADVRISGVALVNLAISGHTLEPHTQYTWGLHRGGVSTPGLGGEDVLVNVASGVSLNLRLLKGPRFDAHHAHAEMEYFEASGTATAWSGIVLEYDESSGIYFEFGRNGMSGTAKADVTWGEVRIFDEYVHKQWWLKTANMAYPPAWYTAPNGNYDVKRCWTFENGAGASVGEAVSGQDGLISGVVPVWRDLKATVEDIVSIPSSDSDHLRSRNIYFAVDTSRNIVMTKGTTVWRATDGGDFNAPNYAITHRLSCPSPIIDSRNAVTDAEKSGIVATSGGVGDDYRGVIQIIRAPLLTGEPEEGIVIIGARYGEMENSGLNITTDVGDQQFRGVLCREEKFLGLEGPQKVWVTSGTSGAGGSERFQPRASKFYQTGHNGRYIESRGRIPETVNSGIFGIGAGGSKGGLSGDLSVSVDAVLNYHIPVLDPYTTNVAMYFSASGGLVINRVRTSPISGIITVVSGTVSAYAADVASGVYISGATEIASGTGKGYILSEREKAILDAQKVGLITDVVSFQTTPRQGSPGGEPTVTLNTTHGVPTQATTTVWWDDRLWYGGDSRDPSYMYFSEDGRPWAVDGVNFLQIGLPGSRINGAAVWNDTLYVFKEDGIFQVFRDATLTYTWKQALAGYQSLAPRAVIATNKGIVFVGLGGPQVFVGTGVERLGGDRVHDLFRDVDRYAIHRTWGFYDEREHRYYLGVVLKIWPLNDRVSDTRFHYNARHRWVRMYAIETGTVIDYTLPASIFRRVAYEGVSPFAEEPIVFGTDFGTVSRFDDYDLQSDATEKFIANREDIAASGAHGNFHYGTIKTVNPFTGSGADVTDVGVVENFGVANDQLRGSPVMCIDGTDKYVMRYVLSNTKTTLVTDNANFGSTNPFSGAVAGDHYVVGGVPFIYRNTVVPEVPKTLNSEWQWLAVSFDKLSGGSYTTSASFGASAAPLRLGIITRMDGNSSYENSGSIHLGVADGQERIHIPTKGFGLGRTCRVTLENLFGNLSGPMRIHGLSIVYVPISLATAT